MTSALTISTASFKDVIREKILLTFMDLIPQEQINALIDSEVKAFFECESLLTVSQTQVQVDNPEYGKNQSGYSHYNSDRKLTRECMAFGSKMTPFRQLVWAELHQHLQPKVKAMLADETNKLTADLNAWLEDTVKPDLQATNKAIFSHMALNMSSIMLKQVQQSAIDSAYSSLSVAMQSVGINANAIPKFPGQL